jgi:hypothetical protein
LRMAIQTSVGGNHRGVNNKRLIFETVLAGEELVLPDGIRIRGLVL